jgi:hypothetical protein
LQAAALGLEKELRDMNNPRVEERIDKILELANHMVSNLQLLKEHKPALDAGSDREGRNGKEGNGPITDVAQTLRDYAVSTPPPIAQIKLPEQMVPTSNVAPHIINTNPRTTKVLPAMKNTNGNAKSGPKITKILPAMDKPATDSNQQKKLN